MKRSTSDVFMPADSRRRDPWAAPWSAQGVVEVLEPLVLEARARRLRDVLAARIDAVTVVLDSPHDPHNGAAVTRSADAFGLASVHVIQHVEPFVITRSVAIGTERWVDVFTHDEPGPAIEQLRSEGRTLVVADAEGELNPEQLRTIDRLALIMGNEKSGVSPALRAAADHTVRIPMRGFVESLNVSVSTAILLRAATENRPGDLSETAQTRWLARGLFHTVARPEFILANLTPR